jgi:hypothetical protein
MKRLFSNKSTTGWKKKRVSCIIFHLLPQAKVDGCPPGKQTNAGFWVGDVEAISEWGGQGLWSRLRGLSWSEVERVAKGGKIDKSLSYM